MLSLFLHWVHLLSVVFWIGGVGYVVLVLLPNMRLIALRDRARFVPVMMRRFLTVVWISIALIVFSGLYRVLFVMQITTLEPFFFTRYGNILLLKLVLVAALIGVAASVSYRVYPRTVRHVITHLNDEPSVYSCKECSWVVGSIKNHLETGLAVAAVIIFLAAMLRGA